MEQDGVLCDNSQRLEAVNYYHKALHFGCFSSTKSVSLHQLFITNYGPNFPIVIRDSFLPQFVVTFSNKAVVICNNILPGFVMKARHTLLLLV